MGFVEDEDNPRDALKVVKALTPGSPPPYQQASGTAARRPTEGSILLQTLTKNKNDVMYNHLLNDFSVSKDYHTDGTVKTERVNVTWNRDRVQCGWCQSWFVTEQAYLVHKRHYDSGCEEHRVCFGHSRHVIHSRDYEHDRCFVSGCTWKYRETDGWDEEDIEKHVKKAHGWQKRQS